MMESVVSSQTGKDGNIQINVTLEITARELLDDVELEEVCRAITEQFEKQKHQHMRAFTHKLRTAIQRTVCYTASSTMLYEACELCKISPESIAELTTLSPLLKPQVLRCQKWQLLPDCQIEGLLKDLLEFEPAWKLLFRCYGSEDRYLLTDSGLLYKLEARR